MIFKFHSKVPLSCLFLFFDPLIHLKIVFPLGPTSLPIHIPQCEKLFKQREKQKPVHKRRPVPKAPQGFNARGINVNGN